MLDGAANSQLLIKIMTIILSNCNIIWDQNASTSVKLRNKENNRSIVA
jgi:hypothetical protein